MENKTFRELYNEQKAKSTPAQAFVIETANLTKKSISTVRMWLAGLQTPDALTQSVIAAHFNVEVSGLFPHPNDTENGH